MIFLISSIAYKAVYAENYLNLYSSTVISTESKYGHEVKYDKSNVIMLFGVKSSGSFGVNAEFFLNWSGIGAAAGAYAGTPDFSLGLGLISVSDFSKGNISEFGKTDSNESGAGIYLSASYKLILLRYVRYDVNHNYRKTIITGYNTVTNHIKTPIYSTGKSSDDITREMIWLGVTVPF